MSKKIILAGGTGFIGSYFEKRLKVLGYKVIIISRQPPHITWDDEMEMKTALENSEMVINLAGKSVNCRYHSKNKDAILQSRVETTEILGKVIEQCTNPPKLWINSSTATIYKHAEDQPMTETSGELGSGFSVEVAKEWEQTFFNFDLPKTRQVALRTAVVLGPNCPVMTPYKYMVKHGLGGVQGPGNQMFSWIHLEDLLRIVQFVQENENISGVINCSSPNPVTNRELMHNLRTTLNRTFGFPSPKWMLEIGAFLLRTETELVLKSRWVVPEKLLSEGFQFKYPDLKETLQESFK